MGDERDLVPIFEALRAAVAEGRIEEAVATRDSLPEAVRRRPTIRILDARILVAQGQDDAALAELAALSEQGWREDVVLRLRAQIEERQERFADLEATLSRLAAMDDASPALHLRIARSRLNRGDLEGARTANAAAGDAGAPDVDVLVQRAAILTRASETEALVETLERLVELRPDEVEDRRRLATALVRLGRAERAREVAWSLVEARPDLAAAYEIAFTVLTDTGAPAPEVARVIEQAVARAATAPRFFKALIRFLDLPKADVARLEDALCDRWPQEYGLEFGRGGGVVDPESAVLLVALDDKEQALTAAEALMAERAPPMIVGTRKLLSSVVRAMPDRRELTRDLVTDDGGEVLVSPQGSTGTTVLAFSGAALRLGYSFEVVDALLARRGASAIYLRDRSLTMFFNGLPSLGPSREHAVDALRAKVEALGTRRLVVLTSSAGALGGLACALPLLPDRIVLISPQTRMASADYETRGIAPSLLALMRSFEATQPPADLDLRRRLEERPPEPLDLRISYGQDNPFDAQQAERLAGLPGVTLLPLPGWVDHGTIARLMVDRSLEPLLLD